MRYVLEPSTHVTTVLLINTPNIQKAETIRLRLGLAAYKVRTGQTDVPLEHLQVRPIILSHGGSQHTLPSSSLFAQCQQQQTFKYMDARRPLPSGIAISAFGSSGGSSAVRRPSQEGGQQQATTVTANPSPVQIEQQHSEETGSEQSSNEQLHHKSSPPMMHSAPLGNEPDSLPRLEPPVPYQRDRSQLFQEFNLTNGTLENTGARLEDTELDGLPRAANGLLSLARG